MGNRSWKGGIAAGDLVWYGRLHSQHCMAQEFGCWALTAICLDRRLSVMTASADGIKMVCFCSLLLRIKFEKRVEVPYQASS